MAALFQDVPTLFFCFFIFGVLRAAIVARSRFVQGDVRMVGAGSSGDELTV